MLYETYPGAQILIVDDQEIDLELLRHVLVQAGYQHVMGITDPREALTVVAEHPPDLILLDLLMPHLDGYGVMAQLRQVIPAGEYLPIVMLTAETTADARRSALARGVDDFLTKPFDPTEVLLRVRNLLSTRMLHLQVRKQNDRLEEQVGERTRELELRTQELEEARAQVLALYQELARRNLDLQALVDRMSGRRKPPADAATTPATEARRRSLAESLTSREHEVLRLLARGRTNSEIGQALVISAGTVKWHVENIIGKLGVADRTQAAVQAVELGLLHP